MKTDSAALSQPTSSEESAAYPLYYSALVKIKGTEARASRYTLVTTKLSDSETRGYLSGENLRAELDKQLANELSFIEVLGTSTALEPGTTSESFPHRPTGEFTFAERFTTGLVEDTDLVASTPHRLFSFFNAHFIPESVYFWLFTGLVIGTSITNIARVIGNIFDLRRSAKKVKAEAGAASENIKLCNSTIGLGNPIPKEEPSTGTLLGARLDGVFKFLFSVSLWYWVLWSIASATQGIGAATIPFGPVIAFTIPLLIALIQNFGDQAFQYVFNKEAQIKIVDKLNFEILEKLGLIDEASGKKDQRSLQQHLTRIDTILQENPNIIDTKKLIEKPSTSTKNIRLALSTLMGFGAGFIMMTLIFFALTPFIGTGLESIVIPFVASAVCGFVYAIKAYRESSSISAQHDKAFASVGVAYRDAQLIDKLNKFYQIILSKRQALSERSMQAGIGPAVPFAAAVDNPDFIFKAKIAPKTMLGRLWTKFKKVLHRIIIFIGGTESGSLLFRVTFGLVGGLTTLGLAANPLSLMTIGIIMLFIALGWGITKYCHFLSEKIIAEEKMFLEQSEIYIRSLSCEYDYLEGLITARAPTLKDATEGETASLLGELPKDGSHPAAALSDTKPIGRDRSSTASKDTDPAGEQETALPSHSSPPGSQASNPPISPRSAELGGIAAALEQGVAHAIASAAHNTGSGAPALTDEPEPAKQDPSRELSDDVKDREGEGEGEGGSEAKHP